MIATAVNDGWHIIDEYNKKYGPQARALGDSVVHPYKFTSMVSNFHTLQPMAKVVFVGEWDLLLFLNIYYFPYQYIGDEELSFSNYKY